MIGTLLNVAGILIGGMVGLARRKPMSPVNEAFAKVALAAFTVLCGLRLTWMSLHGPFGAVLKQLTIIVLALILGRLTGRLLGLQRRSNKLGRKARETISAPATTDRSKSAAGFETCAALFCAAPLGMVGAVVDGLNSPPYFYPLGIKGVIDGLAAMSFISIFGSSVLVSALPVLALQGTITLLCWRWLEPVLCAHGLIDPVNGVAGLLVFSVALVMLGLKKIELTDYLPSLIFAPVIAALW
jgi:uncharacterized protein